MESSLAFYDKVVDIWYKFLASVRGDAKLAENVGEAQLSEGMDMLTRVLNTRVNLLGENHIATVSGPANRNPRIIFVVRDTSCVSSCMCAALGSLEPYLICCDLYRNEVHIQVLVACCCVLVGVHKVVVLPIPSAKTCS